MKEGLIQIIKQHLDNIIKCKDDQESIEALVDLSQHLSHYLDTVIYKGRTTA